MVAAAKGQKSKTATTFTIDCTKPVEDKIMDIAQFEKFLLDRIKVDGKTGMLSAKALTLTSSRVLAQLCCSQRSSAV